MKKLILFYVLAASITALASDREPTANFSGAKDCSSIQAQWDQMGLEYAAKRKECDTIHDELVDLVHKRVEAYDKANLPNATVEDGYAYYSSYQEERKKAHEETICSDQAWAINRARADLTLQCK